MPIQQTDWGEIKWLSYSNGEESLTNETNVGLVKVEPGKHEALHVHYDEQILYVLDGEAVCRVNGVKYHMKPGDLYYWPAGVTDELQCLGDVPFRHLLVSNPIDPGEILQIEQKPENISDTFDSKHQIQLLNSAVEAIRTQFLEGLHYAYAIFDCEGNLLHKSTYFPTRCLQCCSPSLDFGAAPCLVNVGGDKNGKEKETFICSHGMTLFLTPMYSYGRFLGTIKSGFLWQSEQSDHQMYGIYDMPTSSVTAVQSLMGKIAKAIQNFCEFNELKGQLNEQELLLDSRSKEQQLIKKDLEIAQVALIDLKINNHFLFNTLNSMASMALKGGNEDLYQSILNLSDLFQNSLQIHENLIPLETELHYLKAYLELQQIRYRDDLILEYDIDESLISAFVPHNFMQPVAENAFIHGFVNKEKKRLTVSVYRSRNRMIVNLSNNGEPLNEQQCRKIQKDMQQYTSHGLSIVYQKLEHAFLDSFSFDVSWNEHEGTVMKISIPLIWEDSDDDTSRYL